MQTAISRINPSHCATLARLQFGASPCNEYAVWLYLLHWASKGELS